MTTQQLQDAKQVAAKRLLRPNGNVVGVGIGRKDVEGVLTQTDCLRIYVVSKLSKDEVSPSDLVPPIILDVQTDIIEIGRFGRKGRGPKKRQPPQPGAPIRVKTDAPNVNSGFIGTLGAVVTDGPNKYILSCNHILAANGRVPRKDAKIVSAEFVGSDPLIATPDTFVELDRNETNSVDCALALLDDPTKVRATFEDTTVVLSSPDAKEPALNMPVKKVGAATDLTHGKIVDIDADLYVDYSFGTFRFDHQVMIDGGRDDFANAGDSGSIVIETNDKGETKQATAMIFAASGRFAVACPLPRVFTELGKKLGKPLKLELGSARAGAKTAP